MPHLEITEVVLIHCNVVNNSCQQNSTVLYTFVPNKSFSQLLDISPKKFTFLKTFDWEFSYIEILLTGQTSNSLEIEDRIKITLVINITCKCYKSITNDKLFSPTKRYKKSTV